MKDFVLHPPSFPLLLLVHTIGPTTTTTITPTSTPKEQRSDVVIVWPARKKEKRNVISQRERPSRSRWFLFFFGQICGILSILKCRQTASHSREEYITSSFKFFYIFLIVFGMYTNALAGGVTETEIRYI